MIDSRASDDGQAIRRRRQCPQCNRRFTTIETASLQVIKRSGAYEPFSREKIISGVGKACQGQLVEERIRANGASQIEAHEIGLTILEPLRELDTIAYLRFASVYSNYDSLDDFENAIRELRENPPESLN